jgi:cellulose synthase/poly-beta-1,6-N-acetylglucosamine synthase-like glycosyltransferase
MIGVLQAAQVFGLLIGCGFLIYLFRGMRRMPICDSPCDLSISVLIPARNEEETLPRLLEGLSRQVSAGGKIEFIVIDDGSDDGTGAAAKEWVRKDPRFKYLRLEDAPSRLLGPKKRALWEGIRSSSGRILITTDADCRVPPEWVKNMAACFAEGADCVVGNVRMSSGATIWSRISAFENVVNSVLNAGVIGSGGALSCIGANFAFRREAFEAVGGYDTGGRSLSGDDDLLLQKFHAAGYRIAFNPAAEATVETPAPVDAAGYWSRKRRHLSAGKRYALIWIVVAAGIYLGTFAGVLSGILRLSGIYPGSFFLYPWISFSLGLWVVFQRGVRFLSEKKWVVWSLIAALLFPLFFSLVQPLTLLPSPAWKGRAPDG